MRKSDIAPINDIEGVCRTIGRICDQGESVSLRQLLKRCDESIQSSRTHDVGRSVSMVNTQDFFSNGYRF